MLSLIQVECPHCGAKGQIMMPPQGSILVGPCPQCEGFVAVFCGRTLPLDNDVMLHGGREEKLAHMMDVLMEFLHQRVEQLLINAESDEDEEEHAALAEETQQERSNDVSEETPRDHGSPEQDKPVEPENPIREDEVESFVDHELELLDNKDYFKAIFG